MIDRPPTPSPGDVTVIVAMDGFAGYKNAAADQPPEANPALDPFYVVALAGDKVGLCRQCAQQLTCGHRGRSGGPLYGVSPFRAPG